MVLKGVGGENVSDIELPLVAKAFHDTPIKTPRNVTKSLQWLPGRARRRNIRGNNLHSAAPFKADQGRPGNDGETLRTQITETSNPSRAQGAPIASQLEDPP
jgi:hypothetical protein